MALKFEPKVSVGSVISGLMAILAVVGSWVGFSNSLTATNVRQDGQIAAAQADIARLDLGLVQQGTAIAGIALNRTDIAVLKSQMEGVGTNLDRMYVVVTDIQRMMRQQSAMLPIAPAALNPTNLAEILQR